MAKFNVVDGGVSDSWDLDVLGTRYYVLGYEDAGNGFCCLRWGCSVSAFAGRWSFVLGFLGDVRWEGGCVMIFGGWGKVG